MGGSLNLLMPVTPSYSASWLSHTHRSPRSSEPGTDLFVPIGTPVFAPADGVIYGYGESIAPPTGRWIGINFDNGLKGRGMHFSQLERRSGRVRRGDLIAYSGASGYGHEDWSHLPGMPGAHVHWSMWESHNPPQLYGYRPDGRPWTVDLMNYIGGPQIAGHGATSPIEEDDMIAARITDRQGVKHHAIIGNGYFRHLLGSDDPEWQKNITTAEDRWVDMNLDQLPSVLRTFACDLAIWDVRKGTLVVRDPLTGTVQAGNLWSAVNQLRSTIANVAVTSAETKAYLEKLAKGK